MNDMSKAQGALSADQAWWNDAKKAAIEGRAGFSIEPEAARGAAKDCEDMIETLQDHLKQAHDLANVPDFGDCWIGKATTKKWRLKADGGPYSATTLIRQQQQLLQTMADTFNAIATTHQQIDEDAAASFGKLGQA